MGKKYRYEERIRERDRERERERERERGGNEMYKAGPKMTWQSLATLNS